MFQLNCVIECDGLLRLMRRIEDDFHWSRLKNCLLIVVRVCGDRVIEIFFVASWIFELSFSMVSNSSKRCIDSGLDSGLFCDIVEPLMFSHEDPSL
jgi:hypothetical protein